MAEYAPAAIRGVYDRVHAKIPTAEFSGIVGDSSHTYGYHRARNVLPWDDYSVVLPPDKAGDGWAASALDIKFPAAAMKIVTSRLMAACKGNDHRVAALREFFGTMDGVRVTGWDRHNPSITTDDSYTTSDDSHLWHVHLSFYRTFANNATALNPIVDVITAAGTPVPVPAPPPPGARLRRPWPHYMAAGNYFGLITGPSTSHGGFYVGERPDIQAIQQRLIVLGYVPGVHNPASSWADGIFEQPTANAVAAWQRARYAKYTTRYGEVWQDDWNRLFTY